ncbi:MAG TPA: BLUF domain-containing protein [Caulobacteraceae bacterium]|nr:BLUF domain-containing protein [Caulobacteraceae bacterium]
MLICKAYLSAARQIQDAASLGAILETSRKNNQRDGVTGMLCAFDSNFLQFLEGAQEAVSATFGRIRHDPRHFRIIELYEEPIDGRLFGNWSMALTPQDTLTAQQMHACRDLQTATVDGAGPRTHRDAVCALLETFRKRAR